MTVRIGPSLRDRVRDALRTVQNNPAELAAIDAIDAAEAKARAAEAERLAKAATKRDAALEARIEAIIEDHVAREQDALRLAAEKVARAQLDAELGITPRTALALSPSPVRITPRILENARAQIAERTPLPWDRQGRTANALRSDEARASGAVDDVEARIAERKAALAAQVAQREATRQANAAARGQASPPAKRR
jgi:hypothetical protein